MKVMIAGAGNVGRSIAAELIGNGHHVVVIEREPRAFKTETLKSVQYETTRAKGYGFQIELCYRVARWGGYTAEVPITFTDRVRGTSKMSLSVMAEEMLLISWWGIRDRIRAARGKGPKLGAPVS